MDSNADECLQRLSLFRRQPPKICERSEGGFFELFASADFDVAHRRLRKQKRLDTRVPVPTHYSCLILEKARAREPAIVSPRSIQYSLRSIGFHVLDKDRRQTGKTLPTIDTYHWLYTRRINTRASVEMSPVIGQRNGNQKNQST
jgi:hypothetical protein